MGQWLGSDAIKIATFHAEDSNGEHQKTSRA